MWSRQSALDALVKLVMHHPSLAPRVIEVMGNELAKFAAEPELNGNLAWELGTLQATKWLPTIRQAFDRGLIDDELVGDWSDFADHHKPDMWPAA
jgi:hypothetical protein